MQCDFSVRVSVSNSYHSKLDDRSFHLFFEKIALHLNVRLGSSLKLSLIMVKTAVVRLDVQ